MKFVLLFLFATQSVVVFADKVKAPMVSSLPGVYVSNNVSDTSTDWTGYHYNHKVGLLEVSCGSADKNTHNSPCDSKTHFLPVTTSTLKFIGLSSDGQSFSTEIT